MPRISAYPTLINDLKSISIGELSKWGYTRVGFWKSGTITWSRNGEKTGSIGIATDVEETRAVLNLSYTCDGKSLDYDVLLERKPSNLGRGWVWYMRCPRTGKRCRKLYLYNAYFVSRAAIPGFYEAQTQSKKYRRECKFYRAYFGRDELYDELYSRYFKPAYRGKLTRRAARLVRKLHQYGRVEAEDLFWMCGPYLEPARAFLAQLDREKG